MSKKPRKKKKPPTFPKSDRLDKRYEALTAEIIRKFSENAEVTLDRKIPGKSGRLRQVDVDVRSSVAGQEIFIAFECKYYKRRVGIGTVDEVIGKIDDINAQIGVIVSDSGFDAGAIARAKDHGRIQLCQLVDSSQGWLRSKLSVPLVVSFVEAKWPYKIKFSRLTGSRNPVESPILIDTPADRELLLDFLRGDANRVFSEFHEWTNKNIGGLLDGANERRVEVTTGAETGLALTFMFNRVTSTYSKDDVLVGAAGLFDAIHQKLSHGEAGSYKLEESHIRSSWTLRDPGFTSSGVTGYRRLSSYSVESATQSVDSIIERLEALK